MLVSIVLLKGSIFAMMCLAKNLGIFFLYKEYARDKTIVLWEVFWWKINSQINQFQSRISEKYDLH
jgi:hypothetical protein